MLKEIASKLERWQSLNSNEKRYLRLSLENDYIQNMNTPIWQVALSWIAFLLFGAFFFYIQSLHHLP